MLTRLLIFASTIAMPAAGALMETTTQVAAVPGIVETAAPGSASSFVDPARLYFTTVDVDALMRATVADRNGQIVGSVTELGIGATGKIQDATVRLSGGPFGLSGDRVTLSFDDLRVERTGTNGFDSFVLHADMTHDRIVAMSDRHDA